MVASLVSITFLLRVVFTFPKQNLREDFIDLVKKDLNVDLELRDVVAIHCLPSDRPGEKPIIVQYAYHNR
jgi:hypothetical protein